MQRRAISASIARHIGRPATSTRGSESLAGRDRLPRFEGRRRTCAPRRGGLLPATSPAPCAPPSRTRDGQKSRPIGPDRSGGDETGRAGGRGGASWQVLGELEEPREDAGGAMPVHLLGVQLLLPAAGD